MADKSTFMILVLDDEPFMRKLLANMLANLGFTAVTTCGSGHMALALIDDAAASPHLIMLDLNMPEMDGIEFVRHLVDRRYKGGLILVSGEDERMQQSVEKLVRAHRISILGYLCKPVLPDRLAALLEQRMRLSPRTPHKARKTYDASELRAAIDGGGLVNHYQPKVSVATGEVVGVETLVRWQHEADGMVFPDQFIGLAESNGLIDPLTQRVLANALADARVWQDLGLSLRVAVNISMDNLSSVDFADFVATQTLEAGMPTQQLVLEITESRLMRDARTPLDILARLRLKRFRLSIDDFGTGHSSLAQLRDIPFDELKIDQGFVHGAWSNSTLRVMYDASLNLARQLGMEVVAEGVEDIEDWKLLCRTGCDIAQGYFIARPMPAADIPSWISDWPRRKPSEFGAED